MVITNEVNLPSIKTLTTNEANVTTGTLITAAPYLGKVCEGVNNEFMLCRQEKKDPRACIDLGKRVTNCGIGVLKNIKKNCLEEFNQYANCIDKSSGNYQLKNCRKTQAVFDKCMKDKLCLERPEFGYFCRGRVHSTSSSAPPPPPCPCHPKVSDPTPRLPECKPRPPARFGSRYFWYTE